MQLADLPPLFELEHVYAVAAFDAYLMLVEEQHVAMLR